MGHRAEDSVATHINQKHFSSEQPRGDKRSRERQERSEVLRYLACKRRGRVCGRRRGAVMLDRRTMRRAGCAFGLLFVSLALLVSHMPAPAELLGPGITSTSTLQLPEIQQLVMPFQEYQGEFPKSYFAAAPNPTAQYAWVCPGPSRLDDSHSGACPESSTGGYRCCIDSKTGGAVTDDMCCPRNEKQLATKLLAPSTQSLAKRLTGTLEGLVLKLEKAAQPKPPPQADAEYMSRSEAQGDLNSYFDSLSSKPAPKRSLASKRAQEDLNGFFHELGKGTLAGLVFQRKPWKPPPLPDPSNEVKEVVRAYARQLHRDLEHKGVSVAKSEFEQWRQRAMGHRRRLSPLKVAAAEEDVQQQRAKEIGKETADRWNRKQVHYFTGAPGGKEERDGGELDLGDGLVGVRARQVRNIGSR